MLPIGAPMPDLSILVHNFLGVSITYEGIVVIIINKAKEPTLIHKSSSTITTTTGAKSSYKDLLEDDFNNLVFGEGSKQGLDDILQV